MHRPGKRLFLFLSLLFLSFLQGTGAWAQDKTGEIDKLFSWATQESPGCVCAVAQNGKVVVNRAYGLADLERDVPLTTQSVFDVASLTKQFVAAAVLMLVEEKRLSLTDDVRKYIPELPDYGHAITLDHLMTHTSGLRDWTGIHRFSATSADAFTLVLRQRGLDFNPGEEWAYSNSGYVLLKEIIARKTGMPFSRFARKRMFEPLGMKGTTYQDDLQEVVKNRALAYEKENGRWKMDMAFGNERGGGGALFSTASDLLLWNEALTTGRLGTFVTEKLQEPAKLNNGRKLGYARGLYLNSVRESKVIGHTGGSSGYGSILTRIPDHHFSLAILCNSGDAGDRMAFARRIFELLVPDAKPAGAGDRKPDVAEGTTPAAAPDLRGRAGLFFHEQTGESLRLLVNNNRLVIAGGPTLVPISGDHFRNPQGQLEFLSGDKFELHFPSADVLELKSMEGGTSRYRRARAYTPKPEDLKTFAGRYGSHEVGAVFRIEPKGDGLLLRLEHAPDKNMEFRPVDPDTFQGGRMQIRFRRDKGGRVVSLLYSNPVMRNVPFTSLKEAAGSR